MSPDSINYLVPTYKVVSRGKRQPCGCVEGGGGSVVRGVRRRAAISGGVFVAQQYAQPHALPKLRETQFPFLILKHYSKQTQRTAKNASTNLKNNRF